MRKKRKKEKRKKKKEKRKKKKEKKEKKNYGFGNTIFVLLLVTTNPISPSWII